MDCFTKGGRSNPSATSRCGSLLPCCSLLLLTCALRMTSSHSEAVTPRAPTVNNTINAISFESVFGGKGANEAIALARLGVTVRMVGRIKNDLFGGQWSKTPLATKNLLEDTDGLRRPP